MGQNRFPGLGGVMGPANSGQVITPNDTQMLSQVTRGLYLGTGGDVALMLAGGDTLTFKNLAGGIIHPLRVAKVLATGTTAQDIIGVY